MRTKYLRNLKFSVSRCRFDSQKITAKTFVKRGQPMIATLLRVQLTLGGTISPNWARICSCYLRELNLLKKTNGIPFVVKYLKACSVILQQVVAGYKIHDLTPLGLRLKRSKSGLPSIIPKYHRRLICSGNVRVIRTWLTLFSLYRDLTFKGSLKINTITDPSKESSTAGEINLYLKEFSDLFFKSQDKLFQPVESLNQILTAGPQTDSLSWNTSTNSVDKSFIAFHHKDNVKVLEALKGLIDLTNNKSLAKLLDHSYQVHSNQLNEWCPKSDGILGKLAIKEEAAGKIRLFAMVDPWTQWCLQPLHYKLFNVLDRIPTDGTFNQMEPLKRIPWGKVPLYSFDLSAATDRLPIWLQVNLLASVYGKVFASLWSALLVGRSYKTPSRLLMDQNGISYKESLPSKVYYAIGQPMGALSSWAMLALTHHYILQFCAWSTCVTPVGTLFTEYAVLGDDIIIWNKAVADKYLLTLKSLGVDINLAKSILSKKGKGLEFAKRTFLKGQDVSPVPFKEMSAAHRNISSLKSFMIKYNMNALKALRFLGYGYKVDPSKKNKVVGMLDLALSIPSNFREFYSIFSIKYSSRGIWDTLFPRSELNRQMIRFIHSNLLRLHRISKDRYYSFLGFTTGKWLNTIGPWRNHNDIIQYEIIKRYEKRYLADLEYALFSSKAALHSMKDLVEFYNSPFFDIPFTKRQESPILSKDIQSNVRLIFTLTDILDKCQIAMLMDPKRGFSSETRFEESKQTLRMYNHWSMTLSKVTSIRGTAKEFNPQKYGNVY